jgi:hypothetical protein
MPAHYSVWFSSRMCLCFLIWNNLELLHNILYLGAVPINMNKLQCFTKETKTLYVRLGPRGTFFIWNAKLLFPFRERKHTHCLTAKNSLHEQRRLGVSFFYLYFTLNGKWSSLKESTVCFFLKGYIIKTKEGCNFTIVIWWQDQRTKILNLAAKTDETRWKLILINFLSLSLPLLNLQHVWE